MVGQGCAPLAPPRHRRREERRATSAAYFCMMAALRGFMVRVNVPSSTLRCGRGGGGGPPEEEVRSGGVRVVGEEEN